MAVVRFRIALALAGSVLALSGAGGETPSEPERALTEAVAQHRALLREAEQLAASRGVAASGELAAALGSLAAFEASLVERELLPSGAVTAVASRSRSTNGAAAVDSERAARGAAAVDSERIAHGAADRGFAVRLRSDHSRVWMPPPAFEIAAAPVSAPPPQDSASGEAVRLGRLVADGAPEPVLESEMERLVQTGDASASEVRALVQEVLWVAVARTAVELRRAVNTVRQDEELRAALRAELRALRAALGEASGDLRVLLGQNVESLEGRLRVADDAARLADLDLRSLLKRQEPLLQNLARIGAALHDRAMAAIR